MLFLDRVRDRLKDSHRRQRIDRFEGNGAQMAFAGLEVLAEDMDKQNEAWENIRQMLQTNMPANGDGSEENPFTRQFIGKCFKRHDSALSFGVCERDEGFELTVDPAEGARRHFAIAPDGSICDLAAEASAGRLPFSDPPLVDPGVAPAPTGPKLVDKPCLDCKIMMIQVPGATKRCPACKEAKK